MSRRSLFFLPLVLVITASFGFSQQQLPYLDTKLSPAKRAHDLVGRMTLDEKANQLEDWATSIPRLGVPDYQTWNEALHGVARAGYSTVFPQAIGMAATWDPGIVHAMGNVISTEARAKYNEAQRQDNHRIVQVLKPIETERLREMLERAWRIRHFGEDPSQSATPPNQVTTGYQPRLK